MSRKTKLHVVYALAALVSAIAFTPLVIPSNVTGPWLMGLPRTLWSGVLVTCALVFLAFLAARFSPTDLDDPEALTPNDDRPAA